MPKVENASMNSADSAISDFLSSLGISFSSDVTKDADGNVTGKYIYGSVPEDSFTYRTYQRLRWYVKTDNSEQLFCYCSSISFYDKYDDEGNFLGRFVDISGDCRVYGFTLPTAIVYSYGVGGFGFYKSWVFINDNGCPYWRDMGVLLAGGGYYDGSVLATKKLRWFNWDGVNDIDAYWGSLNNYEVVNINGSYYFKIPRYNALLKGNGSEGAEVTPQIVEIEEKDATVYYLSGSELMENAIVWYLINISVDMTEEGIIQNSELVDETVAQVIREQPFLFPNIGLAVNERTKRVISKIILG